MPTHSFTKLHTSILIILSTLTILWCSPNPLGVHPANFYRLAKERHLFFPWGATALLGSRLSVCWGFEIIHRHITLSDKDMDEGSACPSDLYLTTRNIRDPRRNSNPQSQNASGSRITPLDRAATGVDVKTLALPFILLVCFNTWQESLEVSGV